MFASFVVSLRPTQAAWIGNSTGKSLHGLFFKLLEQQDAGLANRVHQGVNLRPLTVAPLRGRMRPTEFRFQVVTDQTYWVRYTTLSDELFNAVNKILLDKFLYRGSVVIDGAEFTVQNVAVEPEPSRGWGRISSAEEIWERAENRRNIELHFASPTAFRQNDLNLLFPVPKNAFHSYREKWNAFTPLPIDDDFIPWVERHVAVEAHSLSTRMVWYSDFQKHGFVGWVRYTVTDANPLRLKQLNALADFSFFCGTGHKTTQGMGQTRRAVHDTVE